MVVVSRVPGWSRAAIGQWALAPPRQVWPFRPLNFPIRRDLFNGVAHTTMQCLPVSPPIQNVVDDNIDGKDNQEAQKGQRHDRKDPFNPVHFALAFPAHRFASRPSSDTDTTHAAGTKSCTKTPAAQGIILKRAVGIWIDRNPLQVHSNIYRSRLLCFFLVAIEWSFACLQNRGFDAALRSGRVFWRSGLWRRRRTTAMSR